MREVRLARRSGEQETFVIRRCAMEDLAKILALQEKILAEIRDPAIFAATAEESFVESIREDYCLGAFCGEALAAMTLMVTGRYSERNYAHYLAYPKEAYASCVSMDLTMVDPAYRGYGLQLLFTELREEEAQRLGASEALVTISPDNEHSLHNLMRAGYEIVCTKELYGGLPRHVLRNRLDQTGEQQ